MAYSSLAIDRRLHRRLRIRAANEGVTIRDIVEGALEEVLRGEAVTAPEAIEGTPEEPDNVDVNPFLILEEADQ